VRGWYFKSVVVIQYGDSHRTVMSGFIYTVTLQISDSGLVMTWERLERKLFLSSWQENKMKVFGTEVLRKMYGPVIRLQIRDTCFVWNLHSSLKMTAFWEVAPYSLVFFRCFRCACCLHHQGKHLWNVSKLRDYTAQHPRRQSTSYLRPWEPEISPYIPHCFRVVKQGG
jgi:hypothetical protein